jgi:hypothetical protein
MKSFISCTVLLVLFGAAAISQGDEKKPADLSLKEFKFKVPADQANLFGLNEDEGKLFFYTNGAAEATIKVSAEGEYAVVVKASCDPALNENAKFKLSIDGELVGKETTLTAAEAKEYTLTAKLKKGEHKLAIEFTNDAYKENEYDRNLYVHAVAVKRK